VPATPSPTPAIAALRNMALRETDSLIARSPFFHA
jgi:hypothetical protein